MLLFTNKISTYIILDKEISCTCKQIICYKTRFFWMDSYKCSFYSHLHMQHTYNNKHAYLLLCNIPQHFLLHEWMMCNSSVV